MTTARISSVQVAAGHDGTAELRVTLRHDNGGLSTTTLDEVAVAALLENAGATTTEQLIGLGWEQVRTALQVSWNRFQTGPAGSNGAVKAQQRRSVVQQQITYGNKRCSI